MWNRFRELPGIVADYTLGTVIVVVQMALAERRRLADVALRKPTYHLPS